MKHTQMIRAATETDVPAILALVRELAAYERLTDTCVVTEQDLHANLFGADAPASAMVAEVDGKVVGYAIWFRTFSTFLGKPGIFLEDVYTRPDYRGQGIGKAFLKELARLAVERGYGRMEWSVLKWNQPSIGFYQSLGAQPLHDWQMMRLTGEPLQRLGRG